jgi:hypothetical protein
MPFFLTEVGRFPGGHKRGRCYWCGGGGHGRGCRRWSAGRPPAVGGDARPGDGSGHGSPRPLGPWWDAVRGGRPGRPVRAVVLALTTALASRVLQVAPGSADLAAAGISTAVNVGITVGALLGSILLPGLGVRSTVLAGGLLSLAALAVALGEPPAQASSGTRTTMTGTPERCRSLSGPSPDCHGKARTSADPHGGGPRWVEQGIHHPAG